MAATLGPIQSQNVSTYFLRKERSVLFITLEERGFTGKWVLSL